MLGPIVSRLAVAREIKPLGEGASIPKVEISKRNKSVRRPQNESVTKHIDKTGVWV